MLLLIQVPFAAPNQNLVNTAFARFFHAQNPGLDFILDLIGEKVSAGALCIELPPIFLGALSVRYPASFPSMTSAIIMLSVVDYAGGR